MVVVGKAVLMLVLVLRRPKHMVFCSMLMLMWMWMCVCVCGNGNGILIRPQSFDVYAMW